MFLSCGVHGLMGAQLGGINVYPYVHVWMEPIHIEMCSKFKKWTTK
jgi:hypothetical protein